ncbi:MAG: DUF4446 family protein [Chthonomonas sp.]|nr:DUF4446 family protein [Chthonomonas sp.]
MGALETFAKQNLGVVTAALLILTLAALVLAAVGFSNAAKTRKQLRSLLDGVRGETLEQMLHAHMRERAEQAATLAAHAKALETLESKMESSKRYLGVVRYNAFDDVGGDQSFALALYDETGHGAVISSVVGRSNARVYCKEIEGGQAKKDLSQEEQAALEAAARNRALARQSTK